jgi:biotin transport system ATP-binding protein
MEGKGGDSSPAPPLFMARGIVKVFPNGRRALDGVDLDVHSGECLLIAGSNGSGKTLLMRILTGLAEPTEGSVFFNGIPLETARSALRRSVGLVFQDPDLQFVGETVEEDLAFGPANLGFSKQETAERVKFVLEKTGLDGKKELSPRKLSGGEKRRLAVAGILAMGCDTVIMDEPFANLDWPGVIQVLEIIKQLEEEAKTLIVLTHELEKVLAFAHRLVILHRGSIQDNGAPEEVLNRLKPEYGVRDPRHTYRSVKDCSWL